MRPSWTFQVWLALVWMGFLPSMVLAATPVELAIEMSKQTGRPIFAVAGSET